MTAGDYGVVLSCEGTLGWQPTYEGVPEQPPQEQTLELLPLGQVLNDLVLPNIHKMIKNSWILKWLQYSVMKCSCGNIEDPVAALL